MTAGAVLLVSADARGRRDLSRLFARAGYRTEEAESGEAALDRAASGMLALVIVDLRLEDMSGYGLCHELRERFGHDLPIILVSDERSEPEDRLAGLLIGADDFLTQPFMPDELLARARRLFRSASRDAFPSSDPDLSERESVVLRLLAGGMGQGGIAQELVISPKTVATHIQHVLTKLGVHNRAEAVAFAYRAGLMDERRKHEGPEEDRPPPAPRRQRRRNARAGVPTP